MTPGEVIDCQTDLVERLDDQLFAKIVDSAGSMDYGRSGGFMQEYSTGLSQMCKNNLRVAHTFRVTHDMSMLVEHAANELEELDRFDPTLAPTGAGFVAFDRPLPVVDIRGKVMLIHYLLWGPASAYHHGPNGTSDPCTLMTTFNDTWRQPDEVHEDLKQSHLVPELSGRQSDDVDVVDYFHANETSLTKRWEKYQRTMGRWATVGSSPIFLDQRLGPKTFMVGEDEQAKLVSEGSTPAAATNVSRYLHALWLLMNQTIARKDPEHIERHARRRFERKMKKPAVVTVIKLRREANHDHAHGESDIEWQHKWVVRGHWRWAHCGPHHPLAQEITPGEYRARVWVQPHIKGNLDKPFVQSEKVYSLER